MGLVLRSPLACRQPYILRKALIEHWERERRWLGSNPLPRDRETVHERLKAAMETENIRMRPGMPVATRAGARE